MRQLEFMGRSRIEGIMVTICRSPNYVPGNLMYDSVVLFNLITGFSVRLLSVMPFFNSCRSNAQCS